MKPTIGITRTGQRVHAVVDAPHTLCGTLVRGTDPHFDYADLPPLLRCIVCDMAVMARYPDAFGHEARGRKDATGYPTPPAGNLDRPTRGLRVR